MGLDVIVVGDYSNFLVQLRAFMIPIVTIDYPLTPTRHDSALTFSAIVGGTEVFRYVSPLPPEQVDPILASELPTDAEQRDLRIALMERALSHGQILRNAGYDVQLV